MLVLDEVLLHGTEACNCDNHSIYKSGAKEIAAQEGMSLTFMTKYDQHSVDADSVPIRKADCFRDGIIRSLGISRRGRGQVVADS